MPSWTSGKHCLSRWVTAMIKKDINSTILGILIMLQPILDILSYFAIQVGMTSITSVLRLAIFGGMMLYAFWLSDKKKSYLIFVAVAAVYWILHMIMNARDGYALVSDANGFLRTIQMPAMTLAFVTLFKKSEHFPLVTGKCFGINYAIIGASILLSFVLNMPVPTYEASNLGIKGWFYTGNSQSFILSVMAMPALCYCYLRNRNWIFVALTAAAFTLMFLLGTLVALYSIFITIAVFLIILIWNRDKKWIMAGTLVLALIVTVLVYPLSPSQQVAAAEEQAISRWEDVLEEQDKDPTTEEVLDLSETILQPLVDRFGYDKVLEIYGGDIDGADLIDARQRKINFGRLLMAEKDVWILLFGCEDADMCFQGETFDPENDFPAIFFYYGIVGVALYVLFLSYFAWLLMKDIFRSLKKLPVDKVIIALSLVLSLGCAEMSANVLRRPNASIYISLLLAYAYYVCKVKKEQNYESEPDHSGL